MRLKIFLIAALFLSLTFCVFAQDANEKAFSGLAKIKKTTKIDKFGGVPADEFLPKLERFNNLLKQNQGSQGYVIYYGGYNEPLFRQTTHYVRWKSDEIDKYLFKHFGNFEINFVIGGLRERQTTELWIVPSGEEKPEHKENTELQRELLYKFELLETNVLNFTVASEEKPNTNSGLVYQINNKVDLADLLRVSGSVLKKEEHRRAVLIYYLNDKKSDVQASRDVFEKFVADNAEVNDLDLNRVKIIYGGFRNQSEVESWVVPNDESDPEPTPDFWINPIY